MTMRRPWQAALVLLGVMGLLLIGWSYGALGAVWLLQALPLCG